MSRAMNALVRLHRWRLDELRRDIAEVEAQRQQLMDKDLALATQLQNEQRIIQGDHDLGVAYPRFAGRVADERDGLIRVLEEAEQALSDLRDSAGDAFQDAKKYEIAAEAELRRHKKLQDQREQAMLDEIGLQTHRRQRKSE